VISLDDKTIGRSGSGRSAVWPISLSGEGSVVAYRMAAGADGDLRYWVIVNGKESPPFTYIGRPSLSRDGRVVAYRASLEEEQFIRVGDRVEGPFDWVTDPVVSSDGSTVAYAASVNREGFLKVGGKKSPLPGKPDMIFLSPNGRDAGWLERLPLPDGGSKMRVVAFGRTGESFGLVGNPVISPTEPLVAYGAEDEKRCFVVIGARKVETPDRVGDPVFSPDGRRVGYGARIGREFWWKVLEIP